MCYILHLGIYRELWEEEVTNSAMMRRGLFKWGLNR